MKKQLLILTIALISGFGAHAQYIGLKGGLNLSNLNIDDVDDENLRTGYHFGVYLNVPISDAFAFQPEVLYSTKGAEGAYDIDLGPFGDIDGTATFKLNYIDVPLLGVFRLGDIAEIHVGPYVGFLAGSDYEIEGDFEAEDDLDSDNFKNLDFGLVGGFALNFSAIQVGARYNYGLQEVQDSELAETLLGDAKNSYIQVFAALRLGSYD